ncbi:hypothetical protein DFH29DRAFT_933494 [Suillus ampliporus]|nr:hypothetical protein DFH29DRAFT_933494 [Suillus ampliporus]
MMFSHSSSWVHIIHRAVVPVLVFSFHPTLGTYALIHESYLPQGARFICAWMMHISPSSARNHQRYLPSDADYICPFNPWLFYSKGCYVLIEIACDDR